MGRIGKRVLVTLVGLMISSLVFADEFWVIASFRQAPNAEQALQKWSRTLGPSVQRVDELTSTGERFYRIVVPKSSATKGELEMAGISPWIMRGVPRLSGENVEIDAVEKDAPTPDTQPLSSSPLSVSQQSTPLAPLDQQGRGDVESVDWQRKLLEDYCRDIPPDEDRLQDMCAVWLKAPGGVD